MRDLHKRGKIRVIGVNKAYKELPHTDEWMDAIFFGDANFYRTFKNLDEDGLYDFPGLRICGHEAAAKDKAVHHMSEANGNGFNLDPNKLNWKRNSGTGAINLAYHMAGPGSAIFLFGFDMKPDKHGKAHFHKGYYEFGKKKNEIQERRFNRWITGFPAIARDAKALQVNIFNVCPDSAIEQFQKVDFAQFISIAEHHYIESDIVPEWQDEIVRKFRKAKGQRPKKPKKKKPAKAAKPVVPKRKFDAAHGDRFLVYLGDEILRGVAWADDDTGEYGQFYIGDMIAPRDSRRKDIKLSFRECKADIRVESFNGRHKRWHFIIDKINENGWTTGAEIGVARGNTTFNVLSECPSIETYYAVDHWPAEFKRAGKKFKERKRKANDGRLNLIEKPSTEGAKDVPDGSLDFVFIDADHSEDACRADIRAWLPKVKPDGMILGHDINWDTVLMAVKAELKHFKIWTFDSVWWCWKKDAVKPDPEFVKIRAVFTEGPGNV
jgi:predicted O-methyltransferase YrrM